LVPFSKADQGFLQDFCKNPGWLGALRARHKHGFKKSTLGGQILEQQSSLGKTTPAGSWGQDLEDPHPAFQRYRQDIAWPNSLGWSFDPPRIQADMAFGDEPGREAARLGHAGEPQPFVKPLPWLHAYPSFLAHPSFGLSITSSSAYSPWRFAAPILREQSPFARRKRTGGQGRAVGAIGRRDAGRGLP